MANAEDNQWQSSLSAIDLSAIESLKKLKVEQDVLDERLKAMEDLKGDVANAVYLRVRETIGNARRRSMSSRGRSSRRHATSTRSCARCSSASRPITKP